jgi:hypothetical protein
MRLEELTECHLLHLLNQWRRDLGTNGEKTVQAFLNHGNPTWMQDPTIGIRARLAALVEQMRIDISYGNATYQLGSTYRQDARLVIHQRGPQLALEAICFLPHKEGVEESATEQAAEKFNSKIEEYLSREDPHRRHLALEANYAFRTD